MCLLFKEKDIIHKISQLTNFFITNPYQSICYSLFHFEIYLFKINKIGYDFLISYTYLLVFLSYCFFSFSFFLYFCYQWICYLYDYIFNISRHLKISFILIFNGWSTSTWILLFGSVLKIFILCFFKFPWLETILSVIFSFTFFYFIIIYLGNNLYIIQVFSFFEFCLRFVSN